MNFIWIVADTLRRDHVAAYGNNAIRTPSLDALAAKSVRFERHYAAGFPTMPTRADHFTGRWMMAHMDWHPLPEGEVTLAQVLATKGFYTAAVTDTPFYLRNGMNYDRGFQAFFMMPGQPPPPSRFLEDESYRHESKDERARWSFESDRYAPQTMTKAMEWLERHYKEDFFLYVDTWDPHEPWDAPTYYTELYYPDYDGEIISVPYGHWQDVPGFTEERLKKAHATYCGEVTMVDTWIGHLLRKLENMNLMDKTAIMFTTDHGFYFGEHGGLFGKLTLANRPDGTLYKAYDTGAAWTHSPLYEELVNIPLFVYVPGVRPGVYKGLTSAVDLMPTVLDVLGQEIPGFVEGHSLLPAMRNLELPAREFVVSTMPFASQGQVVRSVDSLRRPLTTPPMTTVTTEAWSLLHSPEQGMSELYHLHTDPRQERNVVHDKPEIAEELHQKLVGFMRETDVATHLLEPRLELRL